MRTVLPVAPSTGRLQRCTALVLCCCLPGCGYLVTHERLVPVQQPAQPDGVRITCPHGHIRVLPVEVNAWRGAHRRDSTFFTLVVEYAGTLASCSRDDVTLAEPDRNQVIGVEAVAKSRRYPDRPGNLVCFYRLRNELVEDRVYHLRLHASRNDCSGTGIRYRLETSREHKWPVEK